MPNFKRLYQKTQDAFSKKWSPLGITPPVWFYFVIVILTCLRTFSYSLELIVQSTLNPISPLMAFAAVLGIPTWGWLMLVALLILIIGMITKRTLGVTLGAALCMTVWFAFTATLGFGWFALGDGGRFFVPALVTSCVWLSVFLVQLREITRNGV